MTNQCKGPKKALTLKGDWFQLHGSGNSRTMLPTCATTQLPLAIKACRVHKLCIHTAFPTNGAQAQC